MFKFNLRRKLIVLSWVVSFLIFTGLALWAYVISAFLYFEHIDSLAEFITRFNAKGTNVSFIQYLIVPAALTGKCVGTYVWAKIIRRFKLLNEATIREFGG